MKSVALIGDVSPTIQFDSNNNNTPSIDELKEAFETRDAEIVKIALALRKLNVEVHLVTHIGLDPLGMAITKHLEDNGCFLYPLPTPSSSIRITDDALDYDHNPHNPFMTDDIPFVAFDHCDYGILFEKDDALLEALFQRKTKTQWITAGFYPSLTLSFKLFGVILDDQALNEEEDRQTICERLILLDIPWVLFFKDDEVILYTSKRTARIPLTSANPELQSQTRSTLIALWILKAALPESAAQFDILAQLTNQKQTR